MATLLAPSRADRAFERLYRRYVADVYRYVLAVLQNEADAEDATQTAFLHAYRAYERGERAERPLNWLIAIAHNVCRQRFRESARRPRLVELEENDVADRPSDEEAPNADEIVRALGFLAFNQRAALVMREMQGRSYDEIAQLLDLSTSAVETLLFRARRALREQLEGTLTCGEAELALSKLADGRLSFADRGPLRAHLRECPECAALERGQRFRRRALRGIGFVPLPSSLTSVVGGGAVGTGVGVGAKAAAVVAAAVLGSSVVAGDATRQRDTPASDVAAPAALAAAVPQSISGPQARARIRARVTRAVAVRRQVSARAAAKPVTAAPAAAAAGASLSAPPEEEATPVAATATPKPSDEPAAASPSPSAPSLPSVPVPSVTTAPPAAPPAAPPVATPSVPGLPEPKLPPPTLPQPTPPPAPVPEAPALPELPSVTVPTVDLPEVELPELEVADKTPKTKPRKP